MSEASNVAKSLRERLSENTEERLGKALSDLLDNPLITGAIGRAFDAREKASQAQEVAMGALNIPSAADIERLTRRLRSVSHRLEGIEDGVHRLDRALSPGTVESRVTAIEDQLSRLSSKLGSEAARPARAAAAAAKATRSKPAGKAKAKPAAKKAPAKAKAASKAKTATKAKAVKAKAPKAKAAGKAKAASKAKAAKAKAPKVKAAAKAKASAGKAKAAGRAKAVKKAASKAKATARKSKAASKASRTKARSS
jgi:hypothetical protein